MVELDLRGAIVKRIHSEAHVIRLIKQVRGVDGVSNCLLFVPEFRLIGLVTAKLQDLFLGKSELILSLLPELSGGPSGIDVFVL